MPHLFWLCSLLVTYRLEGAILDGQTYSVQFFERARLEVHGDWVMLGRVRAEVYSRWQAEGRG